MVYGAPQSNHVPLHTVKNPNQEFYCRAAFGKSHSHTLLKPAIITSAVSFQNFSRFLYVCLDLWSFYLKMGSSVTRVRENISTKVEVSMAVNSGLYGPDCDGQTEQTEGRTAAFRNTAL